MSVKNKTSTPLINTKPSDSKTQVRNFLGQFQNSLTEQLQKLDNKAHFKEDNWTRAHLGGGCTRIIQDGTFFEQGGIGLSEIQGHDIPPSLLGQHPHLKNHSYWGAGVSMVLHPLNPFCPTVHLNYRYFEAGPVWWFGGGADLTPYYPFAKDCIHWHKTHQAAMDKHHSHYYPACKYWCDEYFFNHHRHETRGIGGTFYDYQDGQAGPIIKADYARISEADNRHPIYDLQLPTRNWHDMFAFQQDNAAAFLKAYLPIAEQRQPLVWTEQERAFQLYRRGRYVEFNLLYDRGTLFGLQSKGRTESILMSLPPLVRWQYNYKAEPNSREENLTEKYLKRGIDWVDSKLLIQA